MPLMKIADILVWTSVCADHDDDRIRYAACIQADHFAENGGVLGFFSSVRLGEFSASGGDEMGGGLCSAAAGYLEKHGLMFRGGVNI